MIVGVVADPGFSTRLAQILTDRLPELLRATPLDASAEVDVENVALTLPPATDGSPALDEWFDVLQHKFDLVLVVSEMPRRQASRAVVAEVFRDRMCVFYTPSFGVLGTSRRLLRTVADLLPHLLGTGASGPAPAGTVGSPTRTAAAGWCRRLRSAGCGWWPGWCGAIVRGG